MGDAEDIGYYQILDNYTIWKLETVENNSRFFNAPSPLRSFTNLPLLSSPLVPATSPATFPSNILHEVPLHKKKNLIRNLEILIKEMQQKVNRIKSEIEGQDLENNRSPDSYETLVNPVNSNEIKMVCDAYECSHHKQLVSLQNQFTNLKSDKGCQEGPNVKSLDKNVSMASKILLSNTFLNLNIVSQEIICLKEHLIGFVNDYKSISDWIILQLKQAELKLTEFRNRQTMILNHSNSIKKVTTQSSKQIKKNDLRSYTSLKPSLWNNSITQKLPIKDDIECESINSFKIESFPSSSERDFESGSDCMNVIESVINNSSLSITKSDNPNLKCNRILCRIHSVNTDEKSLATIEQSKKLIILHKNRIKNFEFDHIFTPNASNEEVFENLEHSLKLCLSGINVCVFVYGETSYGKTFTIEGDANNDGLIVKAVNLLLSNLADNSSLTYSAAELKNDSFRDMQLDDLKSSCKLETKQTSDGSICLINWSKVPIVSIDIFINALKKSQSFKKIFPSTTSHVIHTLHINSKLQENEQTFTSKLNIIDLAGSEKIEKNVKDTNRFKEYQHVNKSLCCLGDVLHAIDSKQSHIPYRCSKITHFLQDSLNHDSRQEVILQIIPTELHASDTIATLMFGQRLKSTEMNHSALKSPNGKTFKTSINTSINTGFRPRRPSTGPLDCKLTQRRGSFKSEKGNFI